MDMQINTKAAWCRKQGAAVVTGLVRKKRRTRYLTMEGAERLMRQNAHEIFPLPQTGMVDHRANAAGWPAY
jgi:hypothetical protein